MGSAEKQQAAGGENVNTIHESGVEEAGEVFTAEIKATIQNVDHDDAADLFAGSEDTFQYTCKEATKVRWKLDLILLTMVWLPHYQREKS